MLNKKMQSIEVQTEIVSPLIFKSSHAIGQGRFLVAGGMSAASNAPSSHSCAMAVFDAITSEWVWCKQFPKNRIIDSACVCGNIAVGAITSCFRRSSPSVICLKTEDGSQIGQIETFPSLCCVGGFDRNTFIAGTWENSSQLHFVSKDLRKSITVSDDSHFALRGILGIGEQRFVTTFQRSLPNKMEFTHQMRNSKCEVEWEYVSESDTAIKCDESRIAIFNNAGSGRRTIVEIVDSTHGKKISELIVRGSIANLTHIENDSFVHCTPKYGAFFSTRNFEEQLASFSFPYETPGWLSFAVDRELKIVFACKGNNYQNPSSTIRVFRYS